MLQDYADDALVSKRELDGIASYLHALVKGFSEQRHKSESKGDLPQAVFSILASRDYSYLSRTNSAKYKAQALSAIKKAMQKNEPIPFYYDIGPGYHAAIDSSWEQGRISSEIGLGELLLLGQVDRFSRQVASIYSPGARFSLIIDNICANLINDMPISITEAYSQRLESMISSLGLDETVSIIAESRIFDINRFYKALESQGKDSDHCSMTGKQKCNVERFLGKACSDEEAIARMKRYQQVIQVSEDMLYPLVSGGIHMTQRATESTICFRAFPGSDSRIQCGQVSLEIGEQAMVKPFLLTSSNYSRYSCFALENQGQLPQEVRSYIVAKSNVTQ